MSVNIYEIDQALMDMWDRHVITPRFLIVAPKAERTLMRLKYPKLPHARTAKMRRLRKLKYRRHP